MIESQLLMIQLLRWIAERPRTYADVMDAWRTSCPRLSVWEDAQAEGLVEVGPDTVVLSAIGKRLLDKDPRSRAGGTSPGHPRNPPSGD